MLIILVAAILGFLVLGAVLRFLGGALEGLVMLIAFAVKAPIPFAVCAAAAVSLYYFA